MCPRRMVANQSSAVSLGAMVLAIALGFYAQHAVQPSIDANALAWLAAAALAAMVVGSRDLAVADAPLVIRPSGARARWLALGALGAGAVATATLLSTMRRLPLVALLLWLASMLLGSWAVRGWVIAPPRRVTAPWSARERVGLAAIVVIAALARTLWLATLPRVYFGDEARVATYLHLAYQDGAIPNFFGMGWNAWPAIGLSFEGLFTPLLGLHLWVVRLSSALMGTLAVVATHLLARELFTPRIGLLAASLLAVCRTAIDFSRLGIAHAQVLFLEPLAFLLLWRAVNRGRAMAYLWTGIVTALCLYTYNAGQLVPLLVFGWLILSLVARPARLRTHWRAAALLAAAFVLTLFPYLYNFTDGFTFAANWGQWTIMAHNRQTLSQVTNAWHAGGWTPAWAILSRQIWITWLGFGVLPGGSYDLGYRHGGMLDNVSAALFVVGLGMSIRRLRSGGEAFVVYWWLATVIAGGIFTIDPPAFVRMVGLLPALAVLAALPLDWFLRMTVGARRAVTAGLVTLLLAGAAWDNYTTYFIAFAATPADPFSELARFMEKLPDDEHAALLGVENDLGFNNELFRIEFPGRWRDVAEPAHFLPLHEPLTSPLALVLAPSQVSLADYVRRLYPNARLGAVEGRERQLLFRSLVVAPEEARARTGLALSARRADGSSIDLGCADPFADRLGAPVGSDRLSWRGSVYWPTDQPLPVTVDAAQATIVTIGAAPPIVADGNRSSSVISAPRGWQPIFIDEAAPAARLSISLGPTAAPEPLTRWALRPESSREGLSARYVRGDGSILSAIDPQLDAFATENLLPADSGLLVRMPFTVTWRGALRIDTPGTYAFRAIGSGPYVVRLDGAPLVAAAPVEPEEPAESRATRQLAPGLRPIEVDFDSTRAAHTSRRLFQLLWTPPGGSEELIPPDHFVPQAEG